MDELIYGVVRGVDAPAASADAGADERRLLVFAVDTRTHGAARLLVDVGELELLDEADLPGDAVVTPFVYSVAGPSAAVATAHARFMAHLEREYRAVELVEAPRAIAAAAEARLAGLTAFTPESLADLALGELVGGDWLAYPQSIAVALPDGWEARGVYAAESPADDAWPELIAGLLEAWLEVEALPGRDRPWAPHDWERFLNDPRWAFGLQLEPAADVIATVAAFTRGLAERPERWDRARLEAEYRALFARLEGSGRLRRGQDVKATMRLDDWLDLQLARIRELRQA